MGGGGGAGLGCQAAWIRAAGVPPAIVHCWRPHITCATGSFHVRRSAALVTTRTATAATCGGWSGMTPAWRRGGGTRPCACCTRTPARSCQPVRAASVMLILFARCVGPQLFAELVSVWGCILPR